jgi:polyisoprenyl-teichoic acid--peptidoglycan teichoic acid transferase
VREPDSRTRAERRRELRARYRRRRLLAVAVLLGLFLASGAYAGIGREGGGSEAGHHAAKAGEVGSPSADRDEAQESTVPSVEKDRGRARETTGGPVASRSSEPTHDDPADNPPPENPPKVAEESLVVLVLGVDRRPSAGEESASHSDTMMLVRASPRTGRVQTLSVPRDLLVEVEPGVEDRINTAYLYGGTERATAVMEDLTGVSIDRHAIVDFGGFEEGIDALGGVTLEVDEPIRLGIEGRRVYIPTGRQELDGLEALAYARYRGTACGDLDRIKRQQRLVAALRQQALGWNTITRLPGIVKVAHENVDTNLGLVQAISLARALAGRGEEGGMKSFRLKGDPETLPNGDAVLLPDEAANEQVLEDFRDGGSPTSPGQDRAPAEGPPSSGC